MRETLAQHLGTWQYKNGDVKKLYSVVPQKNGHFQITWSKSGEGLGSIDNVPAREALRRIRDKQRGGYELLTPYSSYEQQLPIPDSASITVAELSKDTNKKNRKAAPKKVRQGFNFMDWLGGKE
jgi:hypothetical protein